MSLTENQQQRSSGGLQIPGLVQSVDQVEQLAFTNNPTTPLPKATTHLDDVDTAESPAVSPANVGPATPAPDSLPGNTRALLLRSQPAATRALTESLPPAPTGSLRPPLVIRGDRTRTRHPIRPPQGRRHVIGIAALALLVLVTVGTMLAVSPLRQEAGWGFNPLSSGSNLVKGDNPSNMNLVAQQATATAVTHQATDGYDPTSNGGPIVNTSGSPHFWPAGVCTFWANSRYHELTGYWVAWLGNAYQWAQGANLAGWHVSQTPHVHSIIVLMPGVQGASGYGHVAIVESVSGNVAHTSNMNWFAAGGGWDIVSYYDFTAGPGVYFVWR